MCRLRPGALPVVGGAGCPKLGFRPALVLCTALRGRGAVLCGGAREVAESCVGLGSAAARRGVRIHGALGVGDEVIRGLVRVCGLWELRCELRLLGALRADAFVLEVVGGAALVKGTHGVEKAGHGAVVLGALVHDAACGGRHVLGMRGLGLRRGCAAGIWP